MKGFDGQFVMAWLLEQGTAPEVIPNGSMIMSVRHPSLNIRVIDSLNFLPMALAKLTGCFGLTELKKGYFPHLFNSRENQSYVGPLPEARYYSPDTMSTPARKAFLSWHKEHKGMCLTSKQRCWPIADRTWTFFVAVAWSFEPSFWMLRVWIHSNT